MVDSVIVCGGWRPVRFSFFGKFGELILMVLIVLLLVVLLFVEM